VFGLKNILIVDVESLIRITRIIFSSASNVVNIKMVPIKFCLSRLGHLLTKNLRAYISYRCNHGDQCIYIDSARNRWFWHEIMHSEFRLSLTTLSSITNDFELHCPMSIIYGLCEIQWHLLLWGKLHYS